MIRDDRFLVGDPDYLTRGWVQDDDMSRALSARFNHLTG